MNTRTVPLAPIRLRAEVTPTDTGKRRAQATIYTGAEMERFDFQDGAYTLRLAMNGADLSRLNAGAPVTRNHSGDIDDVVGVTERAWIADGVALATLRISDREELAALWSDIQSAIVKNVSMDVALLEMEDVTKRGGKKALLATKWQPLGLAIVPAGADSGAQMMALAQGPTHPCRLTMTDKRGFIMRLNKCPKCSTKLTADEELTVCPNEACAADLEAAVAERDENARVGLIHQVGTHYECGDVWIHKHISQGTSERAELVSDATAIRARRTPYISSMNSAAHLDYEAPGFRLDAMAEGLAARSRGVEPEGPGRRYYGASLVECAYDLLRPLGHARGLDVRRNAGRIVELAHTTSDFPLLLGNVLNKMLQPAYELAQPTYRIIAARKTFTDFRPHRFLRRGDFPIPLQVGEAGEITHGTMGENEELVSCLTFARIFGISRVALVNDDVGAFTDLAVAAANRVADFENAHFFNVSILPAAGLGPNLADGVAVYNAAHGNLTGAGALSNTLLGEGRALMMQQTGIDGLKLNAQPRFLLTSPTSLTLAETLVAQIAPAVAADVNPFANRLVALGDANLSGSRFYLLADPARLPQYVYGHLDGFEGPRIEVRRGWESEATEVKVATDYAAGPIESRAGVSGAGA